MLQKLKNALQISSDVFDDELNDLIEAAVIDLHLAGANNDTTIKVDSTDAIVIRAIISYCCFHFEQIHGDLKRAESLKAAYYEQKSMLGTATGYTTWGD